jgi:tRNA modification GTPase
MDLFAYHQDDTIAAIATAPLNAAIAIVRISGKKSLSIAQEIFSGKTKKFQSHKAYFGTIHDNGDSIDDVLLLPMLGPNSYTGDDIVEIHCHGSCFISQKILELILKKGARVAERGEFTYRAFMNGKLDLAQAEAVQELIAAKNELAQKAAKKQLEGFLSKKILSFQEELISIAAEIEAFLDFPEEDIDFFENASLQKRILSLLEEMKKLAETFHEGKKIHQGISCALIGTPNVGKSSLMNILCRKNRSIVTETPGTTRDLIEADVQIGPYHFRLIDTAGIRKTENPIEKEGISKAKEALQEADLSLFLLDASRPISEEDRALYQMVDREKTFLVLNKIDIQNGEMQKAIEQEIQNSMEVKTQISISAKDGKNIELLLEKIQNYVQEKKPSKEEILLTKLRHKEAIDQAIGYLQESSKKIEESKGFELIAEDIRLSLKELQKILGMNITENILEKIFSEFCIGK